MKADYAGNLNISPEQKEKLQEALQQLLGQNIPGLDYVLENASFDSEGKFDLWSIGYRYIFHLGFRF